MSLLGTLAKVAIGVALAKGMQAVTNRASAGGGSAGNAGTGGLFGGVNSSSSKNGGRNTGGLGDMMGSVLGGKSGTRSGGTAAGEMGGLGGMLEQLGRSGGGTSRRTRPKSGGGIGDVLGSLLGGGAAAGGLGGLLGSLTGGGSASTAAPANDRSFGDVLNSSFNNQGEPDVEPTADQNAVAALMLRAMIQAAKADGEIQEAEKQKLLGNLGDVSDAEMAFVQAEMAKPVDIAALVLQIPDGLEQQVYTMSVMAIDLDSAVEAQYLHDLATALAIDKAGVNDIHAQLGVPALYS